MAMEDKQPQDHRIQLTVEVPVHDAVSSQSSGDVAGLENQSKMPVLARFHAGYFRISLSLCGQALLWKTLSEPTDDAHLFRRALGHLPSTAFILLWSIALLTLLFLSLLYLLRCLFHFQMVKAEFLHHVGVNYLFAPWISWLLLLQSSPLINPRATYYLVLWCASALPIVVLDVKIYGQWFTKGKRFLSIVANPTSHLSVIGNLVGARAAAEMGWKEIAVFMFTLGMVHYLVLFVTLYQQSSGGDRLPAMLRPVFFLFIAAPSMASLAWHSIYGTFDAPSKMLFFLSLFLFASLVSRPTLFKKSMRRFHVAWWAYSFPLSFLALASIEYAQERLRARNLRRYPELTREDADDFFVPIDLESLFTYNDPLSEWIEEEEQPVLHDLDISFLDQSIELGELQDSEDEAENEGRRHSISVSRPPNVGLERQTSKRMAPRRHSVSERPTGTDGVSSSSQRRRSLRGKELVVPSSQPSRCYYGSARSDSDSSTDDGNGSDDGLDFTHPNIVVDVEPAGPPGYYPNMSEVHYQQDDRQHTPPHGGTNLPGEGYVSFGYTPTGYYGQPSYGHFDTNSLSSNMQSMSISDRQSQPSSDSWQYHNPSSTSDYTSNDERLPEDTYARFYFHVPGYPYEELDP